MDSDQNSHPANQNEDKSGDQQVFRKNAALAVMLRSGLVLVNLSTAILLARIIGPEQYGTYIFVLAVMSFIALPGRAGMPLIVVREISFQLVDQSWSKILGVIVGVRKLVLWYSFVAGCGVVIAYHFLLPSFFTPTESTALLYVSVLIPPLLLIPVAGAAIRAMDKLLLGQFVETLALPLTFLILVTLTALSFGQALDASSVILLYAMGAGLVSVVGLALQRNTFHRATAGVTADINLRAIVTSLAPLTVVAGMQLIIGKTDIIMLRAMKSPADVGLYQVALQWANLALIAQQAVLMISGPSIARSWRRNDLVAVQRALTSSARLVFLGAVILGLPLIFYGDIVIAKTFGTEYEGAADALSILILGRVIQASYGAVLNIVKVMGWEVLMLKLVALSALLNVVLNYVLIPQYGLIGAAAAGVIASFFWKTALVILTWQREGLSSFIYGGTVD
jgi:O-antigen/teichoic acid export membrane protein